MIEITRFMYHHLKESKEYENSIKTAMHHCDTYDFELTKARKDFPFNIMCIEGLKQGKPLVFLETNDFPKELNFLPAEEKLDSVVDEVVSGERTFEGLKEYILNSIIKVMHDNIHYRDDEVVEGLPYLEKRVDDALVEKKEIKKHLDYRAVYHNFEKKAYEIYKDDLNFSFNVFIPELGKKQEELHRDIILSQAIFQGKPELIISDYYARIADALYGGLRLGSQRLGALFKAYYKHELKQFEEIKGKKTSFEEFDKIIGNVDLSHLSRINEVMEEEARKAIRFKKILKGKI